MQPNVHKAEKQNPKNGDISITDLGFPRGSVVKNPPARTREAISCSNRTRQTLGHLSCLDLGRAQNAGPTESAPLTTTRVPEPERLIAEKCIQPRAGLRQFLAEQPRA